MKSLLGRRLEGEVADLADQLSDRLLAPGDFILLRWYFLQNWLPLLGHDAAMLITLLRNQCFFNDETGEIRDSVWIHNGLSTLAARLGIVNPRQVALWFPAATERGSHKNSVTQATAQENARRQRLQERIAAFVQRSDYRSAVELMTGVSRCSAWTRLHPRMSRSNKRLLICCFQLTMPISSVNSILSWVNHRMIVLRLSKMAEWLF